MSGKRPALPPPAPLRTGRESFPSSGSSRCKAPRKRSRCHDGLIPACHLYDTGLQPSHPALSPSQRTHTWINPRSFAFPPVEGFTGFLVTIDPAGSRPACAVEWLQLLSALLPGGFGFLQRSVAPHPFNLPCGRLSPRRRDGGFTMFRSNSEG
jgi:hypothetical protein